MAKNENTSFEQNLTLGKNGEVESVQLKRRSFPIWTLLLLLPLLLLIKCNKTIEVTCIDAENRSTIAGAPVDLEYTSHFVFDNGKFFPDSLVHRTVVSDENGVAVFDTLRCSVYSYIFYCLSEVKIWATTQCGSGDTLRNFHYVCKTDLLIYPERVDLRFQILDRKTGKPIPGAEIYTSLPVDGGGPVSPAAISDSEGFCVLPKMGRCATIEDFWVSAEGYKKGSVDNLTCNVPDGIVRKIYLDPLDNGEGEEEEEVEEEEEEEEEQHQQEITIEPEEMKGEKGDLRINLQWRGKTDLDLYVMDPCGNEIWYRAKNATCSGSTGALDVDANNIEKGEAYVTNTPQENIFWNNPTPGQYLIGVGCQEFADYMSMPAQGTVDFIVTIEDKHGRKTRQGTVQEKQFLEFWRYRYNP